jgi:hypothetical protein
LPIDNPCLGLGCDKCLTNTRCSFCSGTISVDANTATGVSTTTNAGTVNKDVSVCVAANADATLKCSAAGNTISAVCPVVAGTTGPSTNSGSGVTTVDTDKLQNEVATAANSNPIASRYYIIITLVVKSTGERGSVNVTMFVTLQGSVVPTQGDLDAVCPILKDALTKSDTTVPKEINCRLIPKTTNAGTKRQASGSSYDYYGELTYAAPPAADSASTAFVSFVALAAAVFYALF